MIHILNMFDIVDLVVRFELLIDIGMTRFLRHGVLFLNSAVFDTA